MADLLPALVGIVGRKGTNLPAFCLSVFRSEQCFYESVTPEFLVPSAKKTGAEGSFQDFLSVSNPQCSVLPASVSLPLAWPCQPLPPLTTTALSYAPAILAPPAPLAFNPPLARRKSGKTNFISFPLVSRSVTTLFMHLIHSQFLIIRGKVSPKVRQELVRKGKEKKPV